MTLPQTIQPEPQTLPADPMVTMIERVVLDPSASIEKLERMLAMKERLDGANARKAFDLAMSAAKAAIPPIIKNRTVSHETRTGGTKSYKHEDLAEIARTIDPILSEHGLSYRYRTKQEGDRLLVTCVVSHRDGYSEDTTLSGPLDPSGNKNAHQAIGSAVTYLQRYTLKAALGLAVAQDDDGAAGSTPIGITADQFLGLRDLMDRSGADEEKFLAHFKIDMLDNLPAARLAEADRMLRAKLAQKGAA